MTREAGGAEIVIALNQISNMWGKQGGLLLGLQLYEPRYQ
jgi:hypothetical protein